MRGAAQHAAAGIKHVELSAYDLAVFTHNRPVPRIALESLQLQSDSVIWPSPSDAVGDWLMNALCPFDLSALRVLSIGWHMQILRWQQITPALQTLEAIDFSLMYAFLYYPNYPGDNTVRLSGLPMRDLPVLEIEMRDFQGDLGPENLYEHFPRLRSRNLTSSLDQVRLISNGAPLGASFFLKALASIPLPLPGRRHRLALALRDVLPRRLARLGPEDLHDLLLLQRAVPRVAVPDRGERRADGCRRRGAKRVARRRGRGAEAACHGGVVLDVLVDRVKSDLRVLEPVLRARDGEEERTVADGEALVARGRGGAARGRREARGGGEGPCPRCLIDLGLSFFTSVRSCGMGKPRRFVGLGGRDATATTSRDCMRTTGARGSCSVGNADIVGSVRSGVEMENMGMSSNMDVDRWVERNAGARWRQEAMGSCGHANRMLGSIVPRSFFCGSTTVTAVAHAFLGAKHQVHGLGIFLTPDGDKSKILPFGTAFGA
ncbi:hypothetical protein DFH09DRAFT_1468387 [Mycena vulgaris]|nr:hypothetical protein DFH09DRAFT_1468387 [Mycena vulgaris]